MAQTATTTKEKRAFEVTSPIANIRDITTNGNADNVKPIVRRLSSTTSSQNRRSLASKSYVRGVTPSSATESNNIDADVRRAGTRRLKGSKGGDDDDDDEESASKSKKSKTGKTGKSSKGEGGQFVVYAQNVDALFQTLDGEIVAFDIEEDSDDLAICNSELCSGLAKALVEGDEDDDGCDTIELAFADEAGHTYSVACPSPISQNITTTQTACVLSTGGACTLTFTETFPWKVTIDTPANSRSIVTTTCCDFELPTAAPTTANITRREF